MIDASRKRILLVDDDPSIAELVQLALPEYAVDVVSDAETALVASRTAPPSLFIVDLILPGMRGTTLALLLRDEPLFSETPIFLLSGLIEAPSGESREPVRVNGFTAFGKPFQLEKLQTHVRLHIEEPENAQAALQALERGRIAGE